MVFLTGFELKEATRSSLVKEDFKGKKLVPFYPILAHYFYLS